MENHLHEHERIIEQEILRSKEINMHFLAAISHEIRNPINVMVGLVHLLQSSKTEEEREQYTEGLIRTSGNLLELVNNIMDFSKIESGKLNLFYKPLDLRSSIQQNLLGHKTIAEAKGLNFDFRFSEELPQYVIADSVKLNQVLLNLVSNAVKFTHRGSVSVSVEVKERSENSVEVQFAVSDTGKGIPPEKLKSIFDAFDQGADEINLEFGGTGLGLSISKRVIATLGGDLEVHSNTNTGSVFSFTLDMEIAHPETEDISRGTPEKWISLAQRTYILVVDDSPLNAMVAQKSLEECGFQVVLAHNGLNAVKQIQEKKIDIILMDIHMPEMDGLEAAQVIANLPGMEKIPIIALTGSTDYTSVKNIPVAGFTDFMIKPFHPDDLLQKVVKNLEEHSVFWKKSLES